MKRNLVALVSFLSGLVFGVGLLLAEMNRPPKVLGFLDIAGPWDPSLAFVMIGAIIVAFFAFRFVGRRPTSLLGEPIRLPATTAIDGKLLAGSAIFGLGWGLGGVCPGPALVDLGLYDAGALVFVVAMLAGMVVEKRLFASRN
jgi:uncharacterized membrane protein YedE/YeeE